MGCAPAGDEVAAVTVVVCTEGCGSVCLAVVIGVTAVVIIVLLIVIIIIVVCLCRRRRDGKSPCCCRRRRRHSTTADGPAHTTVVAVGKHASGDYSEIPNVVAYTPTPPPLAAGAHDCPDYLHVLEEPPYYRKPSTDPDYLHLPDSTSSPVILTTL